MQVPLTLNHNAREITYVSLPISPVDAQSINIQSNIQYAPIYKSSTDTHIAHYKPTFIQVEMSSSNNKLSSKISSPTNESYSVNTDFYKTNNTEGQTLTMRLASVSSPSLISHGSPKIRDISSYNNQIDSLKVLEYEEFTARKNNSLERRVLSQFEESKKNAGSSKGFEDNIKVVNSHDVNIATKNQSPQRHQHKGRRRDNITSARLQGSSDSSTKEVAEKKDGLHKSKAGSYGGTFNAQLNRKEDRVEFSTENSEYSSIQQPKDTSTLLKEVELLRSILKEKEKLLSKDMRTKQSRDELLIKNSTLAKENARLRVELSNTIESLRAKNEEAKTLNHESKTEREHLRGLEERIRTAEAVRLQSEKENEEHITNLIRLREESAIQQEKKKQYKQDFLSMKESYEQLALKFSLYLNDNNEEKLKEEMNMKIENCVLKIDSLNQTVRRQEDAIFSKDNEIDDLLEKIDLLVKSLGFKDDEIATLQREVSTMQEKLVNTKIKKVKNRTKSSGESRSREPIRRPVQYMTREESLRSSNIASPSYKSYQPVDIQKTLKLPFKDDSTQEFLSLNSDRTHLNKEQSKSFERRAVDLDTIKLKNLGQIEKMQGMPKEPKNVVRYASARDCGFRDEKMSYILQSKPENMMTAESIMTEHNDFAIKINPCETTKPKTNVPPIIEIEKAKILRSLTELKNLQTENYNQSVLSSSRTARKSAVHSGRVSSTKEQLRINMLQQFNQDSNQDSVEIEHDSFTKEEDPSAGRRSKSKSSSKTKKMKQQSDPYSIAITTPKPSLASVPVSRIASNTHYKDESTSARSAKEILFKEFMTSRGKEGLSDILNSESNRNQPKNRRTTPSRKDMLNEGHKHHEAATRSQQKKKIKKKSIS